MTKRVSVHIGLNSFDPVAYGSDGALIACENDARDMAAVAEELGYEPNEVLTADATCAVVLGAIAQAATDFTAAGGGHFLLTYSGHGGRVPALGTGEEDQLDETWCLFDTQLRDNDIHHALAAFGSDVQIIVLSDSCHSGSVTRLDAAAWEQALKADGHGRGKRPPLDVTLTEFAQNRDRYVERDADTSGEVVASGVLLSGCTDEQESMDGEQNGAFTDAFLTCWNAGAFAGSFNDLLEGIQSALTAGGYVQNPQLSPVGDEDDRYVSLLNAQPVPW